MASTDKDGYTRIPNKLLEAMYDRKHHFTQLQFRVMCYIIRKTYGWNKYSDYISISAMAKDLRRERRNVFRAVSDLEKSGVLKIIRTGAGKVNDICINPPSDWGRPVS